MNVFVIDNDQEAWWNSESLITTQQDVSWKHVSSVFKMPKTTQDIDEVLALLQDWEQIFWLDEVETDIAEPLKSLAFEHGKKITDFLNRTQH